MTREARACARPPRARVEGGADIEEKESGKLTVLKTPLCSLASTCSTAKGCGDERAAREMRRVEMRRDAPISSLWWLMMMLMMVLVAVQDE